MSVVLYLQVESPIYDFDDDILLVNEDLQPRWLYGGSWLLTRGENNDVSKEVVTNGLLHFTEWVTDVLRVVVVKHA